MADDLRTFILKKDAKIGELLTRITHLENEQTKIVGAHEEQVYDLQEKLAQADSDFVDKCQTCGKVEKHKETQRIIAFLAELCRARQTKSIENGDDVEAAILMHEHEVIKSVIEKIQDKFSEDGIDDDDDLDD